MEKGIGVEMTKKEIMCETTKKEESQVISEEILEKPDKLDEIDLEHYTDTIGA